MTTTTTQRPAPAHPLAAFDPRLGDLPHVGLGRFPTAVTRLAGLLPASVELWVKRDDESGALYGGNKVRKLEFVLAEAEALGRRRLVTVGGFGSHHVLATSVYGRARGFAVDAVVFPQPITDHVRETVQSASATGMRYHPVGGFVQVLPAVAALRLARGSYYVAPGGSSPTGSLGYVAGALELAAQVAAGLLPAPEVIYVALGSCGTVAGLLVGLRLAGLRARVVAVQVVDAIVCNRRATLGLARRTAALLSRRGVAVPPNSDDDLHVESRFFGGAYGVGTPEAEAAERRARQAGLHLETTYTAKAAAALIADAEAGLLDGKRVLYWHTFSSVDPGALLAAAPDPATLPSRLAAIFQSERGR